MLTSLKKLLSLFDRKEKIKFCMVSFLLLFNGLFEMASVGIVPAFLAAVAYPEKVLKQPVIGPILQRAGLTTPEKLLVAGSIAILLVFLIKNAHMVFTFVLEARFAARQQAQLRARLFRAYMYAPYPFFLQRNSAEIVRNVNQEATKIITLITSLMDVMRSGCSALCIVVMLFCLSPLVALISILILGGGGVMFIKTIQRQISSNAKIALKQSKMMNKCVYQGMEGIKEARILACESSFVESFTDSVRKWVKTIKYRQIVGKLPRSIFELIGIVTILASTLILVLFFKQGISTALPTIALFAVALNRLKTLMNEVIGKYVIFRDHLVSVHPIHDDLRLLEDRSSESVGSDSTGRRISLSKELKIANVAFGYDKGQEPVLKGISLSILKGSSIAFVGPSGSGKTTIVDVILGLLVPSSGQITADGIDIHRDLRAWQKDIGYIPQVIYLADDSIRQNIALGYRIEEIDDDALQAAVQAAQLDEFVSSLPDGLDTVVGERGVRLSGGQRQRIGIARALYHNPDLLIMDEATASLDNASEKAVIKSVNKLKGDRTIIMIAHRLTTVKDCDSLYFIKDGRIEGSGTYDELQEKHHDFKIMTG